MLSIILGINFSFFVAWCLVIICHFLFRNGIYLSWAFLKRVPHIWWTKRSTNIKKKSIFSKWNISFKTNRICAPWWKWKLNWAKVWARECAHLIELMVNIKVTHCFRWKFVFFTFSMDENSRHSFHLLITFILAQVTRCQHWEHPTSGKTHVENLIWSH